MSEPRELELKLEVGPRQLAGLKAKGLRRLGSAGVQTRLASVYFDTADHSLRKKGLSLRVRSVDGRYVQTIKDTAGSGAGLFDRSEWETEIGDRDPDLAAARETPIGEVLADKRAGELNPVFAVDVQRTTWLVEADGAAIEVALDEGTIAADGQGTAIAELELELKRGSAADLFALARRLDETGALRIGILTKSERGYRLLAGENRGFHKADPLRIARGTTTADAFAAIVRACLHHFRRNEAGVVEARLPEALHQARVAMRRLRSALSLFKDLLGDPESETIRSRLRTLSGHFGHARNLDVFLARAADAPEPGAPEPDPDWTAKLRSDREAAYDGIAKALAAKRFRGLMLDILAWAEGGAWRKPADPAAQARLDAPIEIMAAAILSKRRRRVKRCGHDLAGIEPEARHQVRIEAKKLRYAAEFFSGLVERKKDRKRLKVFLSALEELQEGLGDLNDLEAAKALHAAQHVPEGEPPVSAEDDAAREQDLLEAAVGAHKAFGDAKPFWRDFA